MSRNALARLHDLAVFVGAEDDLRTRLRELADKTASVTDAATCSVMLLSEGEEGSPRLKLWCSNQALPAAAWEQTPGRGEGIAGRVLDTGMPLLIADIGQSEFAPLARGREALGASFICVPIAVGKSVIGVMSLSSRPEHPPFDASGLALAEVVAALIGKSVQVERLQTLLRSRVAHLSLAREEPRAAAQLVEGAAPPARVAKLLAKSFFKDLSAAGFEPGQIIEAASEIIALVSTDIRRFKKRAERDKQ
jgi:signal transduction protein with GAF and PtsI domain